MYFTTSTIKAWFPLLEKPTFRKIVIDSVKFIIDDGRIDLHGYVIMPNHLHAIFTVKAGFNLSAIFRDFHKFTSQQMIKDLRNQKSDLLDKFYSGRNDRKYQLWQTSHEPKKIEKYPFFQQKLEYIHNNPCRDKWRLCEKPEDYLYSSARDYLLDEVGPLPIVKPWDLVEGEEHLRGQKRGSLSWD